MKISVIGAGNVGATCAHRLAQKNIAQTVVLLDIKEGLAQGKALDMQQSAHIDAYDCRIQGACNDYQATANSDIVVITSGLPRKPGMSRDDLIHTNAQIVKSVTENVVKHSPKTILIIVSNPLDVMTYQAHMTSALPRTRVIGMAGVLDTARYCAFLAQALNISAQDIKAMLMGGHGDTMVPLPRYTSVNGIPIQELIDPKALHDIIERTKYGGGELVKLMGTSAWYAPGIAAAQMAEAIAKNQNRMLPVCIKLEGEYNIDNCYLGVPAIIGKNGVEKIIQLNLNKQEQNDLNTSRKHVQDVMKVLTNQPKP